MSLEDMFIVDCYELRSWELTAYLIGQFSVSVAGCKTQLVLVSCVDQFPFYGYSGYAIHVMLCYPCYVMLTSR